MPLLESRFNSFNQSINITAMTLVNILHALADLCRLLSNGLAKDKFCKVINTASSQV